MNWLVVDGDQAHDYPPVHTGFLASGTSHGLFRESITLSPLNSAFGKEFKGKIDYQKTVKDRVDGPVPENQGVAERDERSLTLFLEGLDLTAIFWARRTSFNRRPWKGSVALDRRVATLRSRLPFRLL